MVGFGDGKQGSHHTRTQVQVLNYQNWGIILFIFMVFKANLLNNLKAISVWF